MRSRIPVDVIRRFLSKYAYVMTAGGPVNAPGSANMPGPGYDSPSSGMEAPAPGGMPGALDIPGMSIHCVKCFKKVSKGTATCPLCGNDVRNVKKVGERSLEPAEGEVADTGSEAAVSEQRALMTDDSRMGKYSSASKSLWLQMPQFYRDAAGVTSALGGLYGAKKLHDLTSTSVVESTYRRPRNAEGITMMNQALDKVGSVRSGNPVFRLRGLGHKGRTSGSVTEVIASLANRKRKP